MDVKKNGSQPSGKGPAEYFTGTVRIDPLYQAPDPARCSLRVSRSSPARGPMAHPSAGPDLDRDGWLRPGAELGWSGRENSAR